MSDEPGTVGVVGDAPAAVDAAEGAGAETVTGDAAGTTGDAGADLASAAAAVVDAAPDLAVAVGEAALLALVRAGVAAPVVPVAAGRGVDSVPRDAAGPAVEAALAGDVERRDHPVYAVTVAGEPAARILADAGLFAEEPAHISEYSVRTPAGRVARFRADGVVVGTPAGSHGYLSAAGGPVIQPGTGVVGVTPVARFATKRERWVVRPSGLVLAVERGETPVSLVADDRTVRRVPPGEPVRFEADGTLTTLRTADSQPFFG